jgi:hypothetical protein
MLVECYRRSIREIGAIWPHLLCSFFLLFARFVLATTFPSSSVRQVLLFLGCVDASSATARYNLKKGRSLYIYIGGEKEQLMTSPGESKIYVKNRKGFVKLALAHGTHLVPMVMRR